MAVTHPHLWPGWSWLSTSFDWIGFEDVDAGNKCGHDELEIVAVGISHWRLAVKANLAPQTEALACRWVAFFAAYRSVERVYQ